ncbi:hypothetical protein B0H67DRAFT_644518 [Lasiosphaeris hirsuta]|uniref:Uncharacterized protein n=1 Tax=Lasiosphaeris hirsuta TaxID=260670 RepID=A0AA40DT91_9PEZI|nr:hypothetical protein B0H67DRAFT_644518 [Lasiosphaeris hirsuta]
MVVGKQVLLSLAVLCLDTVLGGRLIRDVNDAGPFATASNTSITVPTTTRVPPKVPPKVPPIVVETKPTVVAITETIALDTVSTVYDAGVQQTDTQAAPATTMPTRAAAPPPAIPRPALVVSVLSDSFDLGGGSNTEVDAGVASPTSSEEYVYPAVYGSGGTLTTDDNAPSRSVGASKNSVQPNTGSAKGPPPLETGAATVAFPGAPPSEPDVGMVYGPGEVTATVVTTPTTPAKVPPTPPRGPPPKVTTATGATTTIQQTIDLGVKITTTSTQAPGPGTFPPSQAQSGPSGWWNITTLSTSVLRPNLTAGTGVITSPPANPCQLTGPSGVQTSYSIIYTSTITWIGDPEDYTPLFPPITTPPPCAAPLSPPRLTISFCSSTGSGSKFVTCSVTTTDYNFGHQTYTDAPMLVSTAQPVIILTTDKNPAVVFSTINTPNYGVTAEPQTRDAHTSVTAGNPISTPAYNSRPQSQAVNGPVPVTTPTSPVTVAVKPSAVVINGNTIIDNPSQPTQVVIVSGVTFTINPTEVVGAGATVDRPSMVGGVLVAAPTTTSLGGLQVVVSSGVAVVGGTSFTMNATPTTAIVSGQTVSIGPSAVAVGSQTLAIPSSPSPTEIVVAGGELITAVGQSVIVIQGTTITYGPASSTAVVAGETITFGPAGVTAHGTTLGGKSAKPGDTQFAVVGGATITKVGASVVVIGGSTYTVGPGTGTTTTVVGGETITIGPSGVSMSTLDLPYPFGPTTTITPGGTIADPTASPTASKDAAVGGLRPDGQGLVAAICVAIGMVVMGV